MSRAPRSQEPTLDLQAEPAPPQDAVPAPEVAAAEVVPPQPERPRQRRQNAVALRERMEVAPQTDSARLVEALARAASDPKCNPAKIRELREIQKEIAADEALARFDDAFSRMQPELPVIDKKGRIEIRRKGASGDRDGEIQQSSGFARFEDINEAVKPVLAEFGLWVRFKSIMLRQDGGMTVKIVGILGGFGHREESEFEFPPDQTGSKNFIQGFGSARSYAKRYCIIDLLNISTKGEDDDGKAGGGIPLDTRMSDVQIANLRLLLDAAQCPPERLLTYMNKAFAGRRGVQTMEAIEQIPATLYDDAMRQLLIFQREKKGAEK